MWEILSGLVIVYTSYVVATFRTKSWLAIIARFILSIYTMSMWMSLLVFNSRDHFLSSVLNKLGVGFPLPEKDYGDVCQIYSPDHASGNAFFNITDRIDVFVLAHALGWFVKAFIIRDVYVSWICSILFEIIELCFAHLLPNFNECWWDALIFDVFGCNLIGIHAADYALRFLGWKQFDFIHNAIDARSTMVRFKYMFAASLLIGLVSLIDLNFFFLKFVLFVPTTHWLSHLRTYSLVFISAPASMEMATWARSRTNLSFAHACPSAVIGLTGLITECVLCYIYRDDLFQNAPPTPLWTVLLVVSVLYAIGYSYYKQSCGTKSSRPKRG